MPVLGDPATIDAAAQELAAAANDLQLAREGLAARGRAVTADWTGRAAPAALATIERHADDLGRAVEAVAGSAAPLARYAEALRAAQRDFALGEQIVADGERAYAAVGSGAVSAADRARDEAHQTITDGQNIMATAQERAREANELAARALAEATAGLAAITPPVPLGPVVGDDGTLGDGLVKSVGDVTGEFVDSVAGAATLLNPFSAGFGAAWSGVWETARAAFADPLAAGRTMVEGTVAPVGESYDTGGLDEAIGRTPTVLAGVIGAKGLTKLDKLRALRHETETPLAPHGGLQHHEDAGGHTLAPERVHIGTDEQALFDRLSSNPRIPSASSYFDRAIAEKSVRENLDANIAAVHGWLDDTTLSTRGFDHHHRETVGLTVHRGADSADDAVTVTGSRVVLRRDPSQPDGYYVLTSHPQE